MFTFELANSADFARYGELTQARNRSLTMTLNRAGAFQFTMPLENNSLSDYVNEIISCVLIKFNGEIVWSGPVWQIEETLPNQINVSCVGWLQTLEKRIFNPEWGNPLNYTDEDAGAIAQDVLMKSNTLPGSGPGPTFVNVGTYETTLQRTRNYSPYSNVLEEILNLSEIEAGYDLEVDPITRNLNIYNIIQEDRINVLFEYGTNVLSATRRSDSSKIVNRIYVYGGAGTTTQIVEDAASIAIYGALEEAVSLSDIRDNLILLAYGQSEIAIRSTPLRIINFEPRKFLLTNRDPLIFQDFNIGDRVYVKIKKGRFDVPKQVVRVFSASVLWDDTGSVQVSAIQTTAS